MDKRIFVEKKADFRVKSDSLVKELQHNLSLTTLKVIRIVQVYDVFDLAEDLFVRAEKYIFSEQVTDTVLSEETVQANLANYAFFAIESLPGQFDQRAASSQEALLLLGSSSNVTVKTAQLYLVNKDIDKIELESVKKYLLNPVDSRFKDIKQPIQLEKFSESDKRIPKLTFFESYTEEDFANYKAEQGLAMEVDDLLFIQDYFKSIGRAPTETELKVLDTYWSDHCRHTTFETELKTIDFSASKFQKQLQETYEKYLAMREELGRSEKPQTLMDMATIFGRYERANGRLDDMEVSDEINACSVEIEVDVDGVKEPWLLMFKNETHNHPTEIEPFGGAATCIGGAIRDPLSGRSYVYQAMRISGAGDITAPISATRAGKLPQQVISKTAAHGYSSYGNQIGLATTYVREYFHPGFVAKRMELGAVVGAAPKENVVREKPEAGDVIILLGGKTGRDGIGGATGSSKVQTVESVETAGAEVQKGNAIEERKIQRLFRNGEVTRLIKKSNDFGAGGVCVAIGELADGLEIDLNKVPLKYQGLNGTEIAISESQERMAVVVRPKDVEVFVAECYKENINAVVVAVVTEKPHLVMHWNGEIIVDLERRFLDTNGVRVVVDAKVVDKDVNLPEKRSTSADTLEADALAVLSDLNHTSQKGLQTIFDSSVGRSTVNQPLGGRYQITPTEASVQKLPVQHGVTHTASIIAQGYHPYLAEWSPYHGAAYAVIEATARLVAVGANWSKARFSYQEYFERMDKQAERFGAKIKMGEVSGLKRLENGDIELIIDGKKATAEAVLIGTGSDYNKLNIPNEAEYYARGVHYCATCDGAFYRDKVLSVVGGGNSAVQETIFLTRFASKIHLIVRSKFRASDVLMKELQKYIDEGKVVAHVGNVPKEIAIKDDKVCGVLTTKENKEELIESDGVFVFIGLRPNTGFLKNTDIELDEVGLIKTNNKLETSVKGIFAAGDVRSGATMQIASAAGEGATAAVSIREYLNEKDA